MMSTKSVPALSLLGGCLPQEDWKRRNVKAKKAVVLPPLVLWVERFKACAGEQILSTALLRLRVLRSLPEHHNKYHADHGERNQHLLEIPLRIRQEAPVLLLSL